MDYVILKYNSAGVLQWTGYYNGPGNSTDDMKSMAIDNQGNVYATGESLGSDFTFDIATVKYSTSGVFQWVSRFNSPGGNSHDAGRSISVDPSGNNIYVTGYAGTGGSTYNMITIKYNSN